MLLFFFFLFLPLEIIFAWQQSSNRYRDGKINKKKKIRQKFSISYHNIIFHGFKFKWLFSRIRFLFFLTAHSEQKYIDKFVVTTYFQLFPVFCLFAVFVKKQLFTCWHRRREKANTKNIDSKFCGFKTQKNVFILYSVLF